MPADGIGGSLLRCVSSFSRVYTPLATIASFWMFLKAYQCAYRRASWMMVMGVVVVVLMTVLMMVVVTTGQFLAGIFYFISTR